MPNKDKNKKQYQGKAKANNKPAKSNKPAKAAKPSTVKLANRPNYVGLDDPANKLYSPLDTSIYGANIPNPDKIAEGWGGRTNAEAASWQSELAAKAGLPYVGVDMYGTPGNNIPSSVVDALGIKDHPSSSKLSTIGVWDHDYSTDPRYSGPNATHYKSQEPVGTDVASQIEQAQQPQQHIPPGLFNRPKNEHSRKPRPRYIGGGVHSRGFFEDQGSNPLPSQTGGGFNFEDYLQRRRRRNPTLNSGSHMLDAVARYQGGL